MGTNQKSFVRFVLIRGKCPFLRMHPPKNSRLTGPHEYPNISRVGPSTIMNNKFYGYFWYYGYFSNAKESLLARGFTQTNA